MRFVKLILILFFLSLAAFKVAHEYYVSVTEIEHVKEQKSLQIVSRVFIDDLEKMLRERHDDNIILNVGKNEVVIDGYIEKYYNNKLKITVNGKPVEFEYLGKEYEDDIVFSYLEVTGVEELNSIEVVNEILFDVLPDQQNIVKVKTNGKNKSFILIPANKSRLLNFN
jgi:hypothetical protein